MNNDRTASADNNKLVSPAKTVKRCRGNYSAVFQSAVAQFRVMRALLRRIIAPGIVIPICRSAKQFRSLGRAHNTRGRHYCLLRLTSATDGAALNAASGHAICRAVLGGDFQCHIGQLIACGLAGPIGSAHILASDNSIWQWKSAWKLPSDRCCQRQRASEGRLLTRGKEAEADRFVSATGAAAASRSRSAGPNFACSKKQKARERR